MPRSTPPLPMGADVPERFELEVTSLLSKALASRALILASGSPRRRDLLGRSGLRFEIEPADIPEIRGPNEAPVAFAERLAREKAEAVAQRPGSPAVVLGADTIVVVDEDVLGKPRDAEHACELLARIVGREHRVVTAFAAVDRESGRSHTASCASSVAMREATTSEIREYVATGESLDKAGAYALQGEGRKFVVRVDGSPTNVIGLPVEESLALLLRVAGARA